MLQRYPKGESAPVSKNIEYPLYGRNSTIDGWPLYPKDEIAREHGYTRWYDIYWDLLRDPHCFAVLQKRWMAVVLREWDVEPGDSSARAKRDAQEAKEMFHGLSTSQSDNLKFASIEPLDGFAQVKYGLLKANFYGYSVAEILWESGNKGVIAKDIKVRLQKRFRITIKQGRFELRHLTPQSQYTGEPLPNRKFIFHCYDGDEGNPYGFGLAARLYWPVIFKRQLSRFSLAYADKYGSPTGVGKYPDNRDDLRDALEETIANIGQETSAAIPDSTSIEWLIASGQGNQVYQGLMDYFDREMSKVVLGETGSTDQQGSGGSRARDQIGNEVRIEIAKLDADMLCDTLNKSVLSWWHYFRNGDKGSPPRLVIKFPELDAVEDLNSRASRDSQIVQASQRQLTEKYWTETYGVEFEEKPKPKPSPMDNLGSVFGGDTGESEQPTDTEEVPQEAEPTEDTQPVEEETPEPEFAEDDRLEDAWRKYQKAVNMTANELKKWSTTKASKKASLDRSPINRNLELLSTPKEKWTPKHISWALKTVGFVERMKEVQDGKEVAIGLGKRSISLLNWGYNPTSRSVNKLIKEDFHHG